MNSLRTRLIVVTFTAVLLAALAGAGGAQVRSECVKCHSAYVRGSYLEITREWQQSVHARGGVECVDCHGGDPKAGSMAAVRSDLGFRAHWRKTEIPALCARCHQDPVRMRPYGLNVDQLTQYRTSVHGIRLFGQGDEKVAACTDCHGEHDIFSHRDPRSTVYPTRVIETCARCHADPSYMRPYRIPTDQYAKYRQSVHGRKLLREHDTRAPACPDCHGAHGAAPPGYSEVPAVCGKCHLKQEDYFRRGAHSAAGRSEPKCVTCHGSHDVTPSSDALLAGPAPRHCGACHAAGSPAYQAASDIYAALQRTETEQGETERLLGQAGDDSKMDEQRTKLARAGAGLLEARAIQHAVDFALVRAQTEDTRLVLKTVRRAARDALEARRQRRTTLLVTGLFVLVAAGLLAAWARRRAAATRASAERPNGV